MRLDLSPEQRRAFETWRLQQPKRLGVTEAFAALAIERLETLMLKPAPVRAKVATFSNPNSAGDSDAWLEAIEEIDTGELLRLASS